MPKKLSIFWGNFHNKDFRKAQEQFDTLKNEDKQMVFAELFQKSGSCRMPIMVSVLRRQLHDDQSFNDFYQAWFPSDDMCNKVEMGGQVFQQHFQAPVRVINASNINNSKEIITVAITWVSSKEEEQAL